MLEYSFETEPTFIKKLDIPFVFSGCDWCRLARFDCGLEDFTILTSCRAYAFVLIVEYGDYCE